MLRTNKDCLVTISVEGEIQHPGKNQDYITDGEGMAHVVPATGGIVYSHKVGDVCMGLAGDHTEPGVTTANNKGSFYTKGYSVYSCIGNEARVLTGDAKGAKGFVTGEHDLVHVIIYFPDKDLEKMSLEDKILVKGRGQGLELLDYPDIKVMNVDPDILDGMNIEERDGKLIVPVAHCIPAYLMGSGIGAGSVYQSDYDIMTQDKKTIEELGLTNLRFGDIVLLQDCDNTYGRGYFKGSVTIGVIIHGDCIKPGHGPGVTTIMSSRKPLIEARIDSNANIAAIHPLTKKNFLQGRNQ